MFKIKKKLKRGWEYENKDIKFVYTKMKEKRKLRIIYTAGEEIRTLRTYRNFRKVLKENNIKYYYYDRKNKRYKRTTKEYLISHKVTRKSKNKKEVQKEIIQPSSRIRKQAVLNLRSHENPYSMSIRAITINPEIDNNGLRIAIIETIQELKFDLNNFYERKLGYERLEIPTEEDKALNDLRIHIEVLIKRNAPLKFIK